MIRLRFSVDLQYEVADSPADFILNIQAAKTAAQRVVTESLHFSQDVLPSVHENAGDGGMRLIRLRAESGLFAVHYDATVDIDHHAELPEQIEEVPINRLPTEAISYVYPSRYCQSDRLNKLAVRQFGQLPPGYTRVQAIQTWVQQRVSFMVGSSDASTSAMDTLVESVGVCRDFAHLMIALCRALNIPARFVTGIDYGADPGLGLPDFHAYVEVFVGDRWYLFDPSGISPTMGLVRIGTGRDAADVSFATIFGTVKSAIPAVHVEAVDDPENGFVLPEHSPQALSA
jgi:transglutaminase-like putative cysteine protease